MSQTGSADLSPAPSHARPVIAGFLLALVIAGIGAAGPAVTGIGPWRHHALALGIGLELALASLEVVLAIRGRRSAAAGHPAPALRRALHWAMAAAMVVIGVIALAQVIGHGHGNLVLRLIFGRRSLPKGKAPRLPRLLHPGAVANANYLLYGIIAIIVLAALVVCTILVVRAARTPRRPLADYVDADGGPAGEDLRAALDSGRAALGAVDDARAAIIACYVAMEGSLAAAGAARAVTETPDELLTRAAGSGLIRGQAAVTLTALFYEARFSTHPISAAVRDAARQSLDAISADLTDALHGRPGADRHSGEAVR